MALAFHKGLSTELRFRLQLTGLRLEERDAQLALAGMLTEKYDQNGKPVPGSNRPAVRSEAVSWIHDAVDRVFQNHLELQRQWEEENQDKSPFPPMFVDRVREIAMQVDPDNPMDAIQKILDACDEEVAL